MNKLDKLGVVFNIILSVLYVPMSFFSCLLMMASEGTIDATNQLYINLITVFCYITGLVPLICILGIAFSVFFRKRKRSILSFVIQFLPLVVFVLNVIFLFYIETLPPII